MLMRRTLKISGEQLSRENSQSTDAASVHYFLRENSRSNDAVKGNCFRRVVVAFLLHSVMISL